MVSRYFFCGINIIIFKNFVSLSNLLLSANLYCTQLYCSTHFMHYILQKIISIHRIDLVLSLNWLISFISEIISRNLYRA